MKKLLSVTLTILISFGIATLHADPPTAPEGYHWELVFEDTFDGTTLNTTNWNINYQWATVDSDGGEVRGDNYLLPNHVSVENGMLRLTNSENLFPANIPNNSTTNNNNEYRLMNRTTSRYMYPEGSASTNETKIEQIAYNEFSNWSYSEWKFETSGSDYKLKNKGSGKYLTRTATGAIVQQSATGDNTQLWTMEAVSDGWYNIKNVESGNYLSQDGTYITEESHNTSNNLQFKIFCKLQWISGVVQNNGKLKINRPGYVEASLRMPNSTGTWPAFWLMRDGWPPEIDILEYLSTEPTIVHNIHYKNDNNENKSSIKEYTGTASDYYSKFNTLGFYMGSTNTGVDNMFDWYVNDGWKHGFWSSEYYGQFYDMYAIFSHGNGAWAGFPDANSNFPNYYDCDWFRYWELVSDNGCAGDAIIPYMQVNGGSWDNVSSVSIDPGDEIVIGPHPYNEGTWSWSGAGTSGTSREQTISPTESSIATATYTNDCGAISTLDFTINVAGSCLPTAITPYMQVNGGSWDNVSTISIVPGDEIVIGPHPLDEGTWSWSGAGTSGTSREQTISPTESGIATAVYTNDCGAETTQEFILTVDRQTEVKTLQAFEVNIFPNPTQNVLNISIKEESIQNNVSIAIFNSMGQTVIYRDNIIERMQEFDISQLKKGIYFIRIANDNKEMTYKFMKQ